VVGFGGSDCRTSRRPRLSVPRTVTVPTFLVLLTQEQPLSLGATVGTLAVYPDVGWLFLCVMGNGRKRRIPSMIDSVLLNLDNFCGDQGMAAIVDAEKCTACGECVEACPLNAIEVKDVAVVDNDVCGDCGACVDVCPAEAIKVE
jgi:NAD-dependent dihydropyrimidine dehydrogenase PreA subunit